MASNDERQPESGSEARERTDALWDAGQLGCGELVLELRTRLTAMPGQVLRLIASDPGAPADIPSWCRMTGHTLLREDLATASYWIRARGEETAKPASAAAENIDDIYTPELFALAASLAPGSRLAPPCATGTARSRTCGSTAEIDLRVADGMIVDYAHRVSACLIGRAAAAAVARQIRGTSALDAATISEQMRGMLLRDGPAPAGRWQVLSVLAPVRALPARHSSALVIFDALERAIEASKAS